MYIVHCTLICNSQSSQPLIWYVTSPEHASNENWLLLNIYNGTVYVQQNHPSG